MYKEKCAHAYRDIRSKDTRQKQNFHADAGCGKNAILPVLLFLVVQLLVVERLKLFDLLFGSKNQIVNKKNEKMIHKTYKNGIMCLFSKLNFVFGIPSVYIN
jgi:hypothetical protein